jgi:hypothetical protein
MPKKPARRAELKRDDRLMFRELLKLPLLALISFLIAYSAGWGFKLSGWHPVQTDSQGSSLGSGAAQ